MLPNVDGGLYEYRYQCCLSSQAHVEYMEDPKKFSGYYEEQYVNVVYQVDYLQSFRVSAKRRVLSEIQLFISLICGNRIVLTYVCGSRIYDITV